MDDVRVTGQREATGSDVAAWFDDVYREHWRGMVRLAFVMVGDAAIAEELAQEAFTRVLRRSGEVRDPLPYLRSAVYNACRNHLRSLSRRRAVPSAPESAAPVGDHVIDAIRRLPAHQQALVVLRYYEGLTDQEIAGVTGRPVGSVKSGLHRALTTLREELR